MPVKSIKTETFAARIALVAALLIALVFLFFSLKWTFANAISQVAYREIAEQREVAALAASLAPADPQTHFALAVAHEKTFLADDLPKALEEYEKATSLAPNDFRLWLDLGRARGRSGDLAGAETALRRALDLAPNYAEVQWTLGNVLLRNGKTNEAFAELRKAVSSDAAKYASPAAQIAWQIFDGNLDEIKNALGGDENSGALKAALAVFLAKQKRFDESLAFWSALAENEKKDVFRKNGEELLHELTTAKKFRAAAEIQAQLAGNSSQKIAVGKITNGDFESSVQTENASIFNWRIAEGTHPQIGFDEREKHGGNRSLVLIYNSSDGKEFRGISQIAAVEAGRQYVFEVFYRSDLKTAASLRWEIVDAANESKVLAATDAAAVAGANANWTSLKTEFTTAEDTEAIIIRLAREPCKSSVCPMTGKIWFDDFSLTLK